MKNITIILILIAGYFLFRPRKTETGQKKDSIFSDLISGVYTGSMLTGIFAKGADSSTSPLFIIKPPLISTTDGSTPTSSTTSSTTTTHGLLPAATFGVNNKPLTPFL